MTSKFTLDFGDHTSQSLRSKPNLDRLPMPALLSHLNVRESEWASIYDYAIGVVERAMTREVANKQLDNSTSKVVVSVFGSTNKKRDEVNAMKADNNKQTKKGWTVLLSKCNTILGGYGISSHLMVDPTTSKEYGVEFSCRAAKMKINPNKLILTYDARRKMWSWPRDKVPDELKALHVTQQSWTKVHDYAQITIKNVLSLEERKRKVRSKLLSAHIDSCHSQQMATAGRFVQASVTEAILTAEKIGDEKNMIRYEQEFEWHKLKELATDEFFMWGVHVGLERSANALELAHTGLVFRFQPIVATATANAY